MHHPTLEEILDHPSDILAIIDPASCKVVKANGVFENYYKYKSDSSTGIDITDILGNDVPHEKWLLACQETIKNDYIIIKDWIPNEWLYFSKITAKKKSAVLLRISPQNERSLTDQYKFLFEKNVAGVYKTYYEGGLISCNRAFAKMLGYEDEVDLLSRTAYSLYQNKEDREKFLKDVKANPILVNYEIKLKRKDGGIITCLENTFLEEDEAGNKIISGTIIDITEQKNAEIATQESEERFRTLANVSHESVVFVKKDRTIIDVNDQFAILFGYFSRLDITGRKLSEFITEEDINRIESGIEISSANKGEVRTIDRSGKPLFLDITGSAVNYKGEQVQVFVLNDITARKKAEFTLEQTVVRFRNLLENSPNAIIILTDEKIKYANTVALNLLGVQDEDDVYEKNFLQFIPPIFKSEIKRDLSAVREGVELDYKEIRIKDDDDNEIDVGMLSTLTIYENKPSIQISLNNISERMQLVQEQMRVRIIEEINTVLKREIEEHKKTQQLLEEQKNYTRNIIESSLDMIIAVDVAGKITEFNNASQQQFEVGLDEILGSPLSNVFADFEEYQKVRMELSKKGTFSGEVMNITNTGKTFTSFLSASLIKNEQGRVIGSMGVSRDITEFRANERRAMEQRAKLESIFNSTENMMMWTMNRDHRVTTMNHNLVSWLSSTLHEKIETGRDILTILRQHLDENFYQGQLTSFDQAFSGKPQQFEVPLRDAESNIIWLQVFLNPVYLDDKLEEVSCLVYDNTERREIDRKIRDSLKEKEVLLQEVHHRVKNNLQVISSILNLQSSYVTDEGTLEILQESQNRIKSMSFIHETLYRTTDFSSINFSEYIKSLSYNLIQSYRMQNCDVNFIPNIDVVEMSIDQAIPCGLIVNELVSNALKYAYKDKTEGSLWIDLNEKDGMVTLRIKDDGVGLPENFKFEKTDSLGVQLVYSLTEQLDGTIQVISDGGTTFLINFEKRG
jgi:PAS domain S-box-containing protein